MECLECHMSQGQVPGIFRLVNFKVIVIVDDVTIKDEKL